MFNVTGGELLIILLVALIVLGPEKLPDAVRKAGRLYGELRRMANGFQQELRDAIDEPTRDFRDTMGSMRSTFNDAATGFQTTDDRPDPPMATDLRTAAELERDGASPMELPGEPLDDLDPDDDLTTGAVLADTVPAESPGPQGVAPEPAADPPLSNGEPVPEQPRVGD